MSCDNANLVIETVKCAEDGNGVIVRLYEAFRTRGRAMLKPGFDCLSAAKTNLLEEKIEDLAIENGVP